MSSPSGLLIIRTWIEQGSPEPLRAHIRLSRDVATGFERELTVAHAEAVTSTVQDWLADYVRYATGPPR